MYGYCPRGEVAGFCNHNVSLCCQDDTRNKLGGCGGSAVSKGTADSGVVMESKEVPLLPGIVPRKLPPLTSATSSGLLQQERAAQERQKSSDILEELLNQGIIPEGQTIERSSRAWEAYSLMVGTWFTEVKVVRQRPARLESLKAKQAQALPSIEDIEEKMKLAEERRKVQCVCVCVYQLLPHYFKVVSQHHKVSPPHLYRGGFGNMRKDVKSEVAVHQQSSHFICVCSAICQNPEFLN
uniref:Uncharacterized protein n=1 Tax=Monopterus albus TaxID=43700 RepID=A0A3Q3JXT3_MONAL